MHWSKNKGDTAYDGGNFAHTHFDVSTDNTVQRYEYPKMTLEQVTELDCQLEHLKLSLDENSQRCSLCLLS